MKRLFLTASMAALLLAACTPKAETPADAATAGEASGEAGVASADGAPLPADLGSPAFEEITEDYEIRAVVDPAIVAFDPALAKLLFDVAKESLDALKEQALADKQSADEMAEADGSESWFRQYSMEYRFDATAAQADVISVQQNVYTYTGGAHPNYFLRGMVYQHGKTDPVPVADVVADMAVYGGKLKAGLAQAKMRLGYDDMSVETVTSEITDMLGDDAQAGSVSGANYVLEPSTEEGKFGGITVLFSPYDVGSYAEGSYEITVSAADLAGALTPDWAARFGGEPLPREGKE